MEYLGPLPATAVTMISLLLSGCAQSHKDGVPESRPVTQNGVITLSAVTGLQLPNIQVKSFLANFRDKLNENGKGRVLVNYLGGQDVVPPRKVGEALKRGQFDLLHSPVSYYIGMVPEGYGMMAVNQPPDVLRRNGGWEILQEVFAKKAGARLIAWGESATQFQIYLSEKPKIDRDGLPDFSGIRMRATGTYRPLLGALGATTINIRSQDIMTAMRRNLIKGFGFPDVMIGELGLHETIRCRLVPAFYRTNIVVTMNLKRWNSLTKKTQEFIDRMAVQYERDSIAYVDEQRKKDDAILRSAGVTDIVLSEKGARKFLAIAHDALWRVLAKRSSYATRLRAKLYIP